MTIDGHRQKPHINLRFLTIVFLQSVRFMVITLYPYFLICTVQFIFITVMLCIVN